MFKKYSDDIDLYRINNVTYLQNNAELNYLTVIMLYKTQYYSTNWSHHVSSMKYFI